MRIFDVDLANWGMLPWNPQKRTQAILGAVLHVLDEYETQLPLTIRQVYYRIVAKYDVPKTEQFYTQVQKICANARRAGYISFDALRDDKSVVLRRKYENSSDSVLDDLRNSVSTFRLDPQRNQPVRLYLWTEAAGMAPMVERVAYRYGVPVRSSSGFDSLTVKQSFGSDLVCDPRPAVVLHIGDHDPSGVNVFESLASDVLAFAYSDAPEIDIEFRRIAVTPTQIQDHGLPTAPKKKGDRRPNFEGVGDDPNATVQAEALPPDVLLDIVQTEIEREFSFDAFAELGAQQEEQRADLEARLRNAGLL